jgi:hypothetical protein
MHDTAPGPCADRTPSPALADAPALGASPAAVSLRRLIAGAPFIVLVPASGSSCFEDTTWPSTGKHWLLLLPTFKCRLVAMMTDR